MTLLLPLLAGLAAAFGLAVGLPRLSVGSMGNALSGLAGGGLGAQVLIALGGAPDAGAARVVALALAAAAGGAAVLALIAIARNSMTR